MWTTTTRLHLLNAISRYGLKKTSFIAAYLKVYAKVTSNNWKNEYNKMVKEYFKNRTVAESVKEYFKKKRAHEIELLIEKKKEEKSKIIERMIYGYNSIETSEEESDTLSLNNKSETLELAPEIAKIGEQTISTVWGIKTPNPLSSTLLHLSTLSNLPPHLELPGPKPETKVTPIDMHPQADTNNINSMLRDRMINEEELVNEKDDEGDRQTDAIVCSNKKEQELEEMLTFLETSSGYGISVSSIDNAAFEKFFKWTQEKLVCLENRQRELEEITKQENEVELKAQKMMLQKEMNVLMVDSATGAMQPISDIMKEYYELDFHEYPKKKSPRDKAKWIVEFRTYITERFRSIMNGKITCDKHANTVNEIREGEQLDRKIICARCFDVDALEDSLNDCYNTKPSMTEYVFRGMLFLQTVIFSQHGVASVQEIEKVKSEVYKFYDYYRK